MGAHELLCGAAPSNKMLRIELGGREGRRLNDKIKRMYGLALLAMLKDVPEQDLHKRLQLPKQSRVRRLPLAL